MALAWRIGGPIAGGIVAGVIFEWLALIGLYKLAELLTKNRFVSILTVLLCVLCWPIIWGSLSGMEVGLYSALTFWGLYSYFRSKDFSDKYSYLSYLLFTLAFLARPETAIFLSAFVIRDFYQWRKNKQKSLFPWLIRAVVIVVPLLPYLIFNYSTIGTIFPLTYTAKVQNKGLISSIISGDIKGIAKTLTIFPFYYFQDFYRKILSINPIIVLAIVPGVLRLFKIESVDKSRMVMLISSILLYTPLMGTFVPFYSATFQNYRMVANIIPLSILMGVLGLFPENRIEYRKYGKFLIILAVIFLMIGLAIGGLFRLAGNKIIPLLIENPSGLDSAEYIKTLRFADEAGYGSAVIGIIIIAGFLLLSKPFQDLQLRNLWGILIAFLVVVVGVTTLLPKGWLYANNVRNINECDVEAGLYLRNLAKPGDVVGVSDVGAIGYYSGMEVIDLKGLISPEITVDMINDDSLAFNYLSIGRRVSYLAIAPAWFKYIPRRTDIFIPLKDLKTENNTILARDTTRVYKAVWPEPTVGTVPEPR